jgi:hypothetical protein
MSLEKSLDELFVKIDELIASSAEMKTVMKNVEEHNQNLFVECGEPKTFKAWVTCLVKMANSKGDIEKNQDDKWRKLFTTDNVENASPGYFATLMHNQYIPKSEIELLKKGLNKECPDIKNDNIIAYLSDTINCLLGKIRNHDAAIVTMKKAHDAEVINIIGDERPLLQTKAEALLKIQLERIPDKTWDEIKEKFKNIGICQKEYDNFASMETRAVKIIKMIDCILAKRTEYAAKSQANIAKLESEINPAKARKKQTTGPTKA